MKHNKLFRLLAALLACIVCVAVPMISVAAEEADEPNRALVITNNGDDNPLVRMEALPFNFGFNGGDYHLVAQMNVSDLEAIDSELPANVQLVVKYGCYDSQGKVQTPREVVVLAEFTADTDGWVNLTNADGSHLVIKDFEDDVAIEFVMNNCTGVAMLGDLIIADNTDEIVYSLANDSCFRGISYIRANISNDAEWLWRVAYDVTKASVTVLNNVIYDYTPNHVLTLNIPAVGDDDIWPQGNAYMILDFGTAGATMFPAANGPYTLRGMMKVENFADNDKYPDRLAEFSIGNEHYTGNTFGWVPIRHANGTSYTFNGESGWWDRLMFSWGATGQLSIADLQILDKEGNVVYSFATDASLSEGQIPFWTTQAPYYFWAWDGVSNTNTTKGWYEFSVADEMTTHTAADYELIVVDEEYVPFTPEEESSSAPEDESSSTPEDESSSTPEEESSSVVEEESSSVIEEEPSSEPSPDTGVTGGAALLTALLASAAAALCCKKKD